MPLTTTSAPRQLSDGNAISGGPGTQLGQPGGDKIGFYGTPPVVQPSGQSQAALTRGQAAGVVAIILSGTASPTAVQPTTTGESTITLVTTAGSVFQVATTDLIYVNKPTAQAGLGVGNVRVSAGNTMAVNFSNPTATTITPTASESYVAVAIRGFTNMTGTLSPSAVPPNTTAEYQVAMSGIRAGNLVQVNKPTSQAGLDVVGCRVVSSGTLGITFSNDTASTITPTASEVYVVNSLAGIDAIGNTLLVQSLQSPGSIAANSAAEQALTVTGVATTDFVLGVSKPTAQTGLAVGTNMRISAANTLQLGFGNFTGGAITPTASQTYTFDLYRPAPVAPLVVQQVTLTPTAVGPKTTSEQAFAVPNVVAASPVWVNKGSFTQGIGIAGARVSSAGTVSINFINLTSGTITPPAEVYTIGNFQLPYGDAGSTWLQTASTADQTQSQLANALRTALVDTGLIAGT